MKSGITKLGLAGAVLAVAACGESSPDSGGGDGQVTRLISAEEDALRVFAVNGAGGTQDFADVLARGDVLVARQVTEATYRENYDDDTYTAVDGDVRFQLVGDDLEVTLTLAGEANPVSVTIPGARTLARNDFRIDAGGQFFDIFLGGNLTFAEMLDGARDSSELLRIGVFSQASGDDFALSAQVVIGTETTDDRINELITAGMTVDYSGFGSMDIRRQGEGFDEYNAQLSGRMTMTADFADRSVSGEIANPDLQERIVGVETNNVLAGSILFDDATLRDNAFVGSMSVDQTFEAANADAADILADVDYGGAFYGEDGTAIGGAMSGTGQAGDDDYIVIGNFEVYQD